MNMPTSICQSIRRLLPKQKVPQNLRTISATINTIHHQITPLKVHLRTLFFESLSYLYQFHQFRPGPVYIRKTIHVFRIDEDGSI